MNTVTKTHVRQYLGRAFYAPLGLDAGIDERQLDITQGCRSREKIESLKDETDLAIANGRKLVVIHFGDVFPVKLVSAGSRSIEATKHVHERGFAAAARPHYGDVFVAMNLQGDAAQRTNDFLTHHVVFSDVLNVDHDRPERSD